MFYINHFYSFITMTMVGTTIATTASSWLTIWLGLEINLLSIIPILVKNNSFLSSDSAIKYFIVQAVTSLMIISPTSMSLTNMSVYPENLISSIIIFALCVKAAIAPFHLWLTQIISNAEWPQVAILLTWQKIAPFWVLSSTHSSFFSTQLIIMSAIAGSLGGFLMNNMKKIMMFSAVVHSSWMLAVIFINKMIWLLYFLIYFLLVINLIQYLTSLKSHFLSKINSMYTGSLALIMFSLNVLSISGLPPLLGFFPKMIVIQVFMVNWPNIFIIISLISSTLIALVFYLKMILTISLKPNMVFMKHYLLNKNFIKFLTINTMGVLIVMTFIFN